MEIALVLPAYNEEQNIPFSFARLREGLDKFPEHQFTLFVIDDASSDKTSKAVLHWGNHHRFNFKLSRNLKNRGVAQVLKEIFPKVVDSGCDIIIKTDLDRDFDQSLVLEKLMVFAGRKEQIVAGVRKLPKDLAQLNPYEAQRKEDLLKILHQEFALTGLCPASLGSQFYKKEHLKYLLARPLVQNYKKRWGFELLLNLLSLKLGHKVPVVPFKGNYAPLRRPKEKVDSQYNSYIEIIAELTGKRPEKLSSFYKETLVLKGAKKSVGVKKWMKE